jgi:hypothetical protein
VNNHDLIQDIAYHERSSESRQERADRLVKSQDKLVDGLQDGSKSDVSSSSSSVLSPA